MGWTGGVSAIGLCFVLLGTSFCRSGEAKLVVFSDFDGTIVEDREHAPFNGTFRTPFILQRVPQRFSTIQDKMTGPETIEVSPYHFHRMKPHLSAEGRPGSSRKYTVDDGTQVTLGEYHAINPQSYKYFFSDSAGERNYLLEDLNRAYAEEKDAWKGGYFPMMQALLSHPETAKSFIIGTARGHSASDWNEFFLKLQEMGEIEHLPDVEAFHNVSLDGYDRYDTDGNISNRKKGLLLDIAWRLGRMSHGAHDLRLSPDGKSRGKYHFLIVAEDNMSTLNAWAKEAQHLARSKRLPNNVKFGIFNLGTKTSITDSKRPQFSIVTSDGTFRPATKEELVGEPWVETPALAAFHSVKNCAAEIAAASAVVEAEGAQ